MTQTPKSVDGKNSGRSDQDNKVETSLLINHFKTIQTVHSMSRTENRRAGQSKLISAPRAGVNDDKPTVLILISSMLIWSN